MMKEKIIFNINDFVINTNTKEKVKLLYGPFNKQYNYFFEVEDSNGKVFKLNTKNMKSIN